MSFDPTRRLSESEIKECVHEIISHGGDLVYTLHAKERMTERGYSFRDVQNILTHGSLVDSEENVAAGNWKYRFEGEDLDGDRGAVVIALVMQRKCLVITVLS